MHARCLLNHRSMKEHEGVRVQLHSFLTSTLIAVNGQHHALVALLLTEMGLSGSQNQSGCPGEEKYFLALPVFELRIFQSSSIPSLIQLENGHLDSR